MCFWGLFIVCVCVCFLLLQLEQYKELKELARKQGAVVNQQAEKLHWEVKADHEKIAFDQRRKKEVEVLPSTDLSTCLFL